MTKLYFASDYQEGMTPEILNRLSETNLVPVSGYGTAKMPMCTSLPEEHRPTQS